MKGRPPIFQISSITDQHEYQAIVENIEKLGGSYDNSKVSERERDTKNAHFYLVFDIRLILAKVYVSRATHLIVGSMSTSEKILCFISAGKWVLTKAYISECVKEERFIDETDFHVYNQYAESKLAKVSYM